MPNTIHCCHQSHSSRTRVYISILASSDHSWFLSPYWGLLSSYLQKNSKLHNSSWDHLFFYYFNFFEILRSPTVQTTLYDNINHLPKAKNKNIQPKPSFLAYRLLFPVQMNLELSYNQVICSARRLRATYTKETKYLFSLYPKGIEIVYFWFR